MFFSKNRTYPLRKSRHILKWVYGWYKKKRKTILPSELVELENEMAALDGALLSKDREKASQLAKHIESFANTRCKKTFFEYVLELVFALIFALVIATIVRQMWFELYEIPTGSMRPTFREKDHLTVTKTAFGINWPLETKHLYFDPALVQRTSVVIFSGDGLPLPEVDTTYFGIFPYKKRYIKRLIGKPNDSLYFYGGQIYGVDKEGHEITELKDSPWMKNLEYIPYLSFEGDMNGIKEGVSFKQMHQSVGRLLFSRDYNSLKPTTNGEIFNGKEWIKDNPTAQKSPHREIETYSDFYGIKNFAEARLLTKDEANNFIEPGETLEPAVLYLQLKHTPSLNYPKPLIARSVPGGLAIPGYTTIIPLQQKHLSALMDNLYTARFVVNDGKAFRYSLGEAKVTKDAIDLPHIPNGTYEFYHGLASEILWLGITKEVEKSSPLYSKEPSHIQKLFNFGIDMSTFYQPVKGNDTLFPHRFAYFRNGNLYVMGTLVMEAHEKALIAFHKNEAKKEELSTSTKPYVAFKDYGSPLKSDGSYDVDFIRTFGITIPDHQYLVLGDNHAMSADSRVFGFVKQENLQGAPCDIIWPPAIAQNGGWINRLGSPSQKPYPFMNTPRAIVWSIAALIGLIWFLIHQRNLKRPIYKKLP